MTALLLFDLHALPTADRWQYLLPALVGYAALWALLLSKRFPLLLLGHVLACVAGVAGIRLLFVSSFGGTANALGLVLCLAPALLGVYRLFIRERVQTLEFFGY